MSVERFYNEPRNITSTARLSGSKHQLSIPVGSAAVAARVVGWKMGREEINKKCSWKYFSRIILNVSEIFLLYNNISIQQTKNKAECVKSYCSILCLEKITLRSVNLWPRYELCLCMWRILLVTPLTNDTWHVCWEPHSQNSGHESDKNVLPTPGKIKRYFHPRYVVIFSNNVKLTCFWCFCHQSCLF